MNLIDALIDLDPSFDWRQLKREWAYRLSWPPDAIAMTSALLVGSDAYRRLASPPSGQCWPPHGSSVDAWERAVGETGARLAASARFEARPRYSKLPSDLRALSDAILAEKASELRELRENWGWVKALATLHAAADHACAGLGLPPRGEHLELEVTTNGLLSESGSMARFPVHRARVLPKMRTPQVGVTLRSFSHHAAFDRSPLDVRYQIVSRLVEGDDETVNVLIVPWPKSIEPRHFVPVAVGSETGSRIPGVREFEFSPDACDVGELGRIVAAARAMLGTVHGLVLPESALAEAEVAAVADAARAEGVRFLLTGVRGRKSNFARLAVLVGSGYPPIDQPKHHRWVLNDSQIRQYHLGSRLHPRFRWAASIEIKPRCANLLVGNGWLTLSHVICEDLARTGPAIDLIRAAGPTLVIALLADGPQLTHRWSARYATILADDPGSSVLTVTSLGMAERSKPSNQAGSRAVALWKDSHTGTLPIELAHGSAAIALTLSALRVTEYTADTRSDGGMAACLTLSGVHQIRIP